MTRTREWLYAWLLLLPAAVLLALFTHYPAIANLWHSFYSTPKGARPPSFVGLDNYRALVDDPIFWQALTNNVWYALGTIPASIALALLMAVWVNERLPGRGFLRLAYFTPTVLPMIAVANIWLFFYTPEYGLLAQATGLFGIGRHNWLGTKSTALAALMIVTIWKEAGFFMARRASGCAAPVDVQDLPEGQSRRSRAALRLHFRRRRVASARPRHPRRPENAGVRSPAGRPYAGVNPRHRRLRVTLPPPLTRTRAYG